MREAGAKILIVVVSCLLVAACSEPPSQKADSSQASVLWSQWSQLHTNKIGDALNPEQVALTRALATQARSQLEALPVCSPPEPGVIAGRVVANMNAASLSAPAVAASAPAPLRHLILAVDKVNVTQQAVATLALGMVGPAAKPALGVLENSAGPKNPWAAEALSKITCQKWGPPAMENLVPQASIPPASDDGGCNNHRLAWLLNLASKPGWRWPAGVFASENYSCDALHPADLPQNVVKRAAHALASPRFSDTRKAAIAWLLSLAGTSARPAATALEGLATSSNEELRFNAQTAILAAAVPESVNVMRQWLLQKHVFYWAWQDRVSGLRDFDDELIPILGEALDSYTWSGRAAVAKALGDLHDSKAIPYLIAAINSTDWLTAQAAVASLAQFATTDRKVHEKLERVAKSYWSGRVRRVAQLALTKGIAQYGDPFNPACRSDGSGLACIVALGAFPTQNDQQTCGSKGFKDGYYRLPDGRQAKVHWQLVSHGAVVGRMPKDISEWCEVKGSVTTSLLYGNGWLAGCEGFESDGALVWLSSKAAPAKPIRRMGATFLIDAWGKVLVAGSAPLVAGNAGAVFSITGDEKEGWSLEPFTLLPSVPDAFARADGYLLFKDAENAVAVGSKGDIHTLSCVAPTVSAPAPAT